MNSNNAARLSPTDEFRPFIGVDDYRFGWGGKVYEVHEDGDGYRSYVGEITEVDASKSNAFVGRPVLANCRLEEFTSTLRVGPYSGEDVDYWRLVDESGHVWLEFGESNCNDYYPCFEWHYFAKPGPQTIHDGGKHDE